MKFVAMICIQSNRLNSVPEWYYISDRIPMIPYTKNAWLAKHYATRHEAESAVNLWKNSADVVNTDVREDKFSN